MVAFEYLNWQQFDIYALVTCRGLASIEAQRQQSCLKWLKKQNYDVTTIDFSTGVPPALSALGSFLKFEENFGYALNDTNKNLDAIDEAFSYLEISSETSGMVIEFVNIESVWEENQQWLRALLSTIQNETIRHLALGRRFFALLVISDKESILINQVISENRIAVPFWSNNPEIHEFLI